MKRAYGRWFIPKKHGISLIVVAIASVVVVISPLFVYASKTYAAPSITDDDSTAGSSNIPTAWSSGSAYIGAEFIDSSYIDVVAGGTYTFKDSNGSETVDFSGLSGLYYARSISNYGGDSFTPNSSTKYWDSTSTCSGSNTDIRIVSYSPGTVVVDMDPYLAAQAGSSVTLGNCIPPIVNGSKSIDNLNVYDPMVTTGLNTFHYGTLDGRTTDPEGVTYSTATNSTIMYYEDDGDIFAATDTNPTGNSVYYFKSEGSNDIYQETRAASSSCVDPDTIKPTSTINQNVGTFAYSAHDMGCSTVPYHVLVLTTTAQAAAASLTGGASGTSTVGNVASPDDCPIQNWALRWLVCPVLDTMDDFIAHFADKFLQNLLTIPVSTFNTSIEPGKAYFIAWSDFRDLAVSLIVIAALIMVIGESAGFDLLDAYSIRKVLPRLLTGAVAMTLSWVICAFIIQLFNNLNNWLPDIILSPFQGLYNNGAALNPVGVLGIVSNTAGIALFSGATIIAGYTVLALLTIPGIISLILSLFVAVLVAFVTLTIRTMIIVLWLITSPLGIACYILPTTQKGYHFWRDAGISAFLAGLAIVSFIAAGQVVAIISINGKGVVPLMAPVAIIASYMSVGTAFRAAGGLIGTAAGAVHGAHGGLRNGLKGYRKGKRQGAWSDIKGGRRFGNTLVNHPLNAFGKRVGAMQAGGGLRAFLPGRVGRQARSMYGGIAAEEALKNSHILHAGQNDDDANAVLAGTGGNRRNLRRAALDLWGARDDEGNLTGEWAGRNDEERAATEARARDAMAGARAMGINYGNSLGAFMSMSDNKARAIGAGGNQVYATFAERLSDGNASLQRSILMEGKAKLRTSGRWDLGGIEDVDRDSAAWRRARAAAPGNVNQQWRIVSDAVMMDGISRSGVQHILNAHDNSPAQAAAVASRILTDPETDDQQRIQAAMVLLEMQKGLPGATGGARDAVNRVLYQQRGDDPDQLQHPQGLALTPNDPNNSIANQLAELVRDSGGMIGPITPQLAAFNAQALETMARAYENSMAAQQAGGAGGP